MTENTQPHFSPYWFWKSAVPKNIVDEFLKEVDQCFMVKGETDSNNKFNERDSDVILSNGEHWFSGILANTALNSNINAGWNFAVKGIETFQIARYKDGQHYDWHTDANILLMSPNIRKLTAVCMLSDPDEYEGGDLEIKYAPDLKLEKGDIIVFPSLQLHRVTPVTKGCRLTAATWLFGDKLL